MRVASLGQHAAAVCLAGRLPVAGRATGILTKFRNVVPDFALPPFARLAVVHLQPA
jgi:hypothetical protein